MLQVITEEEYEAHNSKQWYLTADEMLNYGIVDKVIEQNGVF